MLSQEKHRIEAPVNGGRNYNGPKVAKFLVGQVPTCTNGVTIITPVIKESTVKYRSDMLDVLTSAHESGRRTVSGG